MNIKQDSLAGNPAKESIWREKYLESLDAQEKESAQQQETINTLRRGLLSVSLAGDGIDQELDTSLASLRRQLHKLDQQAELNNLLQTIEENLLELDNRKIQKSDGMLTLLDIAILSLGKLKFAQSHKRAIRKFTRKLKKPGDDPKAQLALLEDFIQLCVTIFDNLLQADGTESLSFWQRLFGKQSPTAKKQTQSQAHQPPQSLDSDEIPEPKTVGSQAKPANTEAPAAKVDTSPTALEPKLAAIVQSPTPIGVQSNPAKLTVSETEKMVKEFIYQLLDNIESVEAIQAVAATLRSQLLSSRGEELKTTLEQIQNLFNLASANERNCFRKYLEGLNSSVAQLSKFIGQSQGHSSSLQQLDKSLDTDLRLKLSSIHTNIEKVKDLSDMKSAIKEQLDDMVLVLDESTAKKTKTESDYLAQINSLAEKFEAVEQESKQLRQAMENQKRATEVDNLTKLPNRFAFLERLNKELETLTVTTDPICLCIGDVDGFDQLNRNFGLNAGDKALQLITKQMQKCLGSDDFIARYSADKFALLLPLQSAESGLKALHTICEEIRQTPFKCRNENLDITLSFGITQLTGNEKANIAFERANAALLDAKNAGGDDCYQN
ncbi:MAG: diguanylate cyclase [Pseudohongiellaceae bacterium]|jgi:diguanylate cyclase